MQASESTLAWLLDRRNPCVRAAALRELLGRAEDDPELAAARGAVPSSAWVRRIMRGQHRDGFWINPNNCYLPKFTATVWRLQVLAELGVPGDDPGIRRACERFLWQNSMPDGGFTCGSAAHRRRFSEECVTGHMLFTLERFGLAAEPRVAAAHRWLLGRQRDDGGWNCDHRPQARHSSFVSTLAALKGLAARPSRRPRDAREATARSVEFLLAHRLFRSHRTGEPVKRFWPPRLTLPSHYAYDLLQPLRVLALAGAGVDHRMEEALELLERKADARGRWPVERVPLPASGDLAHAIRIEPEGRPSRWLTLTALTVLRRFGRVSPGI